MLLRLKRSMYVAVLFTFCLLSCKVSWVPDFNAAIEDQIINAAQKNDRLYMEMAESPLPAQYLLYIDKYNEIESEIYSLQLKNEARRNNDKMLVIIKNLREAFNRYRTEHKQKKIISIEQIAVYRTYIKTFWTPLLVAEHGLKAAR